MTFEEMGNMQGKTLMLLPGTCCDWQSNFGSVVDDLARSGNTVLVATHDPELIELCCDYVLCIENGKLGYMKKV